MTISIGCRQCTFFFSTEKLCTFLHLHIKLLGVCVCGNAQGSKPQTHINSSFPKKKQQRKPKLQNVKKEPKRESVHFSNQDFSILSHFVSNRREWPTTKTILGARMCLLHEYKRSPWTNVFSSFFFNRYCTLLCIYTHKHCKPLRVFFWTPSTSFVTANEQQN